MLFNIAFIVGLVALDQLFKFFATTYLMGNGAIVIIPNILGLRYVLNTGAAFSILSEGTNLLIILTAVALLVMAYFLFVKKAGDKAERFCFLLIFAGGVGNLIDRVVAGQVVDYLEFLFMEFAVFNFADILVCLGVGLFAAYTIYVEFIKNRSAK
ncbi:MAG: signal peptidase II [Oscillospiraceae bacterium]